MKHRRSKHWTPFKAAELIGVDKLPAAELPYLDVDVWKNNRYQVTSREIDTQAGSMTHLSIKRLDKTPVHDWRDLQRIKNELCGPEREAVEIYPAESRLVDSANQYHLWVLPADVRLPFGFFERLVTDESTVDGAVQRPFDDPPATIVADRENARRLAASAAVDSTDQKGNQ